MKKLVHAIILLLTTFWVPFSSSAQQPNPALHRLFEKYYDRESYFNPLQATANGLHQYDDLLPNDGSISFITARRDFYTATLKALHQFNRATLSPADQIYYDILEYTLRISLEGLNLHLEYMPFNQFISSVATDLPLFGSGEGPQPFATVKDYENWAKRMTAFKHWTDTAIANFEKGRKAGIVLPKDLVTQMIPQMAALAQRDTAKCIFYAPLRKFPATFSSREKQRLTEMYTRIIPRYVLDSYKALTTYLKNDYLAYAQEQPGLHALPGGDSLYQYFIKLYTTTTSLSADSIYRLGKIEVDRITQEMEQNKKVTGFKGSLQEYFHFLRTDPQFRPFKTPEQVLNAYQSIYHKIQPHLKKLFEFEPKTKFVIRRVEAFQEAAMGGPYYIKGNLKEQRPGTFFVPIPDATKINVVFYGLECTFIHEAIPGHHFQIALQQEQAGLPAFLQQNALYAFMEGWALYCESLGDSLGCYTDPYQKMGALNNEIHRAIRLVVDVGIHTGRLSKEQAIQYMMNHESISREIATKEVERYMAWPAQALSYKIGELKIKALKEKYRQSQGTRFSEPAFHYAMLKYGCMPLDVLERYLDEWSAKL
ncbi:Uncharacterized conserved protein, DUF885 familyt [Chitinophaga jiangningensis]|uniref:Uncharacterized conserved protein, DUF885 familyt n=1 Tax=Chitinophaga jiangningensis TaxID=1419482 RepID=A0A1M7DHZ9_9BACT|nr:DUF885 domain-containing protein [Chitinophaga jiangningensis]SHL79090.1 Uncharacterized conserved protein, DUF885 familyt [Chitinophaga jiangningensis]